MIVGLTFALVLLLGGCSDDDPSPQTTDPAPTTTKPSTTLSQQQEDEQALRQLAEEWFEAVRRIFVDGEDPAIAERYVTGDYLTEFRRHVQDDAANGHVTERDPQGRSRTTVEDVSVTGDRAEIVECVVDADVLKDGDTGEVINDEIAARRFITRAVQTDSGWRLSQRTTESRTEDSEICPA
ncbi:MAG TPA: hypothetical protein VEW93_12995 [Acidimicrobiales bacterium]|nr:hypothetical protein [Acidimicrobiales bacterium]